MNIDAFFDAARQLGLQMQAESQARRQAVKDERNRRRRARYARTAGQPKGTSERVVLDEDYEDEDYEPFCRCHLAAPCVYCTGGAR